MGVVFGGSFEDGHIVLVLDDNGGVTGEVSLLLPSGGKWFAQIAGNVTEEGASAFGEAEGGTVSVEFAMTGVDIISGRLRATEGNDSVSTSFTATPSNAGGVNEFIEMKDASDRNFAIAATAISGAAMAGTILLLRRRKRSPQRNRSKRRDG